MRTELVNGSLVDVLVVCRGLPQDEVDQLEAFAGGFDIQKIAMGAIQESVVTWTVRYKDTREPLVVAGLIQVGTNIWRTWFLATQRAWDDVGREVTLHTMRQLKKILDRQEHIRIETVCLASREKARAWYERVGLDYESTMACYGVNGESAVMYVKTKGAKDD